MKIAGLGTLVLFTAAAAHAAEKLPKCFDRMYEGHCVAADVNGQKTVRMIEKTKKQFRPRRRPWPLSPATRPTCISQRRSA